MTEQGNDESTIDVNDVQIQEETQEQERRRPRRWPWIVGILAALLVGFGTGAAGEPEVVTETVEVEVPGEIPAEDLAELREQKAELDQREADLQTQGAELVDREAELDEREADLEQTELEVAEGTIPGTGVFLVGEDIEPGTYRNEGTDACYWARRSGTSGEFSELIANDNPRGPTVVTIAASDVAFETSRCAEWVRQ